MYHDDYGDGCKGCGHRDYGYDLPDTRAEYYSKACDCPKDSEECDCEQDKIEITIQRKPKECGYCHSYTLFDAEFVVVFIPGAIDEQRKSVCTVPTESLAHKVVEELYPNAKVYVDEAWESERYLRMMGG